VTGLGQEAVPKMEREVLIGTAKTGNEVIFEGLDGAFSGVAGMDTGWDKLEIDFLLLHAGFENL
jgi:hypothetical protein